MDCAPPPDVLRQLLNAAIAAAQPAICVPRALAAEKPTETGRTIVLGAGKAAAAMAHAVETAWPSMDLEGLVVTRYGHAVPCDRIEVAEAAHPVPDQAGADAAARILDLAHQAGPDDLVLFLLSGGASALLSLPRPGLSLSHKQALTHALLAAGADIGEINTVRKHLSAVKGGRLAAAAAPARVLTLAISDVVGDDPAVIGSGPTVADPSTLADARSVLDRYDITPDAAIAVCLSDADAETLKPGAAALAGAHYRLVATPGDALATAAQLARETGIEVEMLGDDLADEARLLGTQHAALVLSLADERRPSTPRLILSGGEATVTLHGAGKGGPNTEYLLALAQGLGGRQDVWALAADTDGADGSEDNAGAIIGPRTLARADALGLRPEDFLANNDAWSFFDALGDLVVTGPTQTNINDFRAILIS